MVILWSVYVKNICPQPGIACLNLYDLNSKLQVVSQAVMHFSWLIRAGG